ncbi:MAG: crossover junction endodeoxyribonuclease RuvC [Alphaproteobacteria bacterium]|nr:crossover junction endodeoxyribonuclease RuvC [Alphaproteobacteria bacterium]
MIVLGIDPGSTVTGYGVVSTERGRYRFVDAGCIKTASSSPMGSRLQAIHDGLVAAIGRHAPDAVAIEAIFHHKSAESALRLGQARGVALLAAAACGHEAFPYNAMTVKQSVGAHGRADKASVARMVQVLLGVRLDLPADATDALAIAITHCSHARSRGLARAVQEAR